MTTTKDVREANEFCRQVDDLAFAFVKSADDTREAVSAAIAVLMKLGVHICKMTNYASHSDTLAAAFYANLKDYYDDVDVPEHIQRLLDAESPKAAAIAERLIAELEREDAQEIFKTYDEVPDELRELANSLLNGLRGGYQH